MNGAGNRSSGQTGPASRLIRQRKRTDYCQLHLSSPFYRGQGPRLAYPALDNPRRNRIIPMNEMALLLGQRRPAVSSSLLLDFFCGRRFRSCGSDRGLSDRPLDPFGHLLCSLSARRMSRSASRLAMVSRLSCSALPRQRPNCSFIRPSFR